MPTIEVAHVREQGVDLIVVPLDRQFGTKTDHAQEQAITELQFRASGAGLRGTIVPIWENGGRIEFRAPTKWHPFFKSISLSWVRQNINRRISW